MFAIQAFDYEEGSGARWYNLAGHTYETRESARDAVKAIRRQQEGEECLLSYRVTEVGSRLYYSQPTDALEY